MQEEETWNTTLLKVRKCDDNIVDKLGNPSLLEERYRQVGHGLDDGDEWWPMISID